MLMLISAHSSLPPSLPHGPITLAQAHAKNLSSAISAKGSSSSASRSLAKSALMLPERSRSTLRALSTATNDDGTPPASAKLAPDTDRTSAPSSTGGSARPPSPPPRRLPRPLLTLTGVAPSSSSSSVSVLPPPSDMSSSRRAAAARAATATLACARARSAARRPPAASSSSSAPASTSARPAPAPARAATAHAASWLKPPSGAPSSGNTSHTAGAPDVARCTGRSIARGTMDTGTAGATNAPSSAGSTMSKTQRTRFASRRSSSWSSSSSLSLSESSPPAARFDARAGRGITRLRALRRAARADAVSRTCTCAYTMPRRQPSGWRTPVSSSSPRRLRLNARLSERMSDTVMPARPAACSDACGLSRKAKHASPARTRSAYLAKPSAPLAEQSPRTSVVDTSAPLASVSRTAASKRSAVQSSGTPSNTSQQLGLVRTSKTPLSTMLAPTLARAQHMALRRSVSTVGRNTTCHAPAPSAPAAPRAGTHVAADTMTSVRRSL
mmetsp:Transcript_4733/g.17160  ORF Transcript_4733/g.17160 Transcript_4733/m.17160 type:complete len:500 (-) Transcript_4733:385-1884(-)